MKRKENEIICNVVIMFSYSNKVLNYNIKTQFIEKNKISLNRLLGVISKKIELKNKAISLYDNDLNSFSYCGIYPKLLHREILFEIDQKVPAIQIKLRSIISKNGQLRSELLEEGDNENLDEKRSNIFINEKSKRAKERKIGDIIKKVYMWRKLYFGYVNESGQEIKLSLEEAAEKIGISKKSLDDYLIQLRIGKMFGFNFTEHKNDKVGILRAFVKKNKPLVENKYTTSGDLFDPDNY